MIYLVLLFSPLIFFVVYNIIIDTRNFKYTVIICKNEGWSNFLRVLWESYFIDKRFVRCPEFDKWEYSNAKLSSIEYILRHYLSSTKGVTFEKAYPYDRSYVKYRLEYQDKLVKLEMYHKGVFCHVFDYLVIPPYHARLIEAAIKKNDKNILDIL